MTSFLDMEAHLGGEFLHPGGYAATEVLLRRLSLQPGGVALELGCGTGATASRVAREIDARVIALDRSSAMLAAARARLRKERLSGYVHLVQTDVGQALPFPDAVFDAVYAESVVALLVAVESVIGECVRVLRPCGRLVLIERIWKPGVPQVLADEINAVSRHAFGIPAATRQSFDRNGWLRLLHQVGLVDVHALPVDTLLPARRPGFHLRHRLTRWRRYLTQPHMVCRSLWFKAMVRRYKALWPHLESYLFLAQKPGS